MDRIIFYIIAVTSMLAISVTIYAEDSQDESLVLYLREGWPENGQPFKKYQPDAGRLLKKPPKKLDEVWCGIWSQHYFDDVLEKPIIVNAVYVNVWLYSVNGSGTSAFHFEGGFDDKITQSTAVEISPENAKSRAYRYDLHCYYQRAGKCF